MLYKTDIFKKMGTVPLSPSSLFLLCFFLASSLLLPRLIDYEVIRL